MSVEIKTVYSKEAILDFNDFLALRRKTTWIIQVICSIIVIFCCIMMVLNQGWTFEPIFYISMILLWDLFQIFAYFVLPRLTVKKAPNLNSKVSYVFTQEHIEIHSENTNSCDHSISQYDLIAKVYRSKQYLYLMLSSNRGWILNLNGLSPDKTAQLRQLLESKLPAKKIHLDN